jgi:ABC-2 type transport system permease protein
MLFLNRLMVQQHMKLVADWWTAVIGMIIEQGTAIAFLGVIFYRIDLIKGWSLHDMVFLLGLFVLSKPVYRVFFQGVADISDFVLEGTLDQFLTRPRNPVILILTSSTNPVAIGDLILGFILLSYGAMHMEVVWSVWRIAYVAALVVCGSMVYVGTLLVKGAACIFVIRIEAMNTLLQQFQEYAKFPFKIYHPLIRVMLATLLPYGLACSIPAAVFLGKDRMPWVGWMAPLFCLVYLALTWALFQWSLRYYRSTGS